MTPSSSPRSVGQRLAAARLQRGLAQKSVARKADLAPSYLSRIENGKVQPTFRTVMNIVTALGADPDEIVGPHGPCDKPAGPCPVTPKGRCLLDLVGRVADLDHYTAREIRLMRRFALWIKRADPARLRAMEILLDDLSQTPGIAPAKG